MPWLDRHPVSDHMNVSTCLFYLHFQINQDSANQGSRGVRKYVGPVNVAVQVIFGLFTPKTNGAQN